MISNRAHGPIRSPSRAARTPGIGCSGLTNSRTTGSPASPSVVADLCVTRVDDTYGVLDNACPHQGGPLGEGSIERGWLRCPWHGYDYSPCNGTPPPPFEDAPARTPWTCEPMVSTWRCRPNRNAVRTVADVLVETMTAWGVDTVFGMVGHSNLGFADAIRAPRLAATSATSRSATKVPLRSP